MVAKDLMASAYHIAMFIGNTDYAARIREMRNRFTVQLGNSLKDDWFEPLYPLFERLESKTLDYERSSHFPFDGNPLLEQLVLSEYIGIGALENLKELMHKDPSQAMQLLQLADNRIQNGHRLVSDLQASLGNIPGYAEAIDFYHTDDNRTVVRLVFPAEYTATLDDEADHYKLAMRAFRALGKLDKRPDGYSFEVLSVAQSSPQHLLLLVQVKTAVAINLILKSILKRWKEVEEIRQLRANIDNINADTEVKKAAKEKILAEIAHMETSEEASARSLAEQMVEDHKLNLDGEPNEVAKDLEFTAEYFQMVINDGGHLHVYMLPQQAEKAYPGTWRSRLLESRQLQTRLEPPTQLLQEHAEPSTDA
jgi:hypothetical protein